MVHTAVTGSSHGRVGNSSRLWKKKSPRSPWKQEYRGFGESVGHVREISQTFPSCYYYSENDVIHYVVQYWYFLAKVINYVAFFPESNHFWFCSFSYLMVVVVIKFRLPALVSIPSQDLLLPFLGWSFPYKSFSGPITLSQCCNIVELTVFVVRSSGTRVLCQSEQSIFFLTVPVAGCISFIGVTTMNTVWNAVVWIHCSFPLKKDERKRDFLQISGIAWMSCLLLKSIGKQLKKVISQPTSRLLYFDNFVT